jgi:hypothetical protein
MALCREDPVKNPRAGRQIGQATTAVKINYISVLTLVPEYLKTVRCGADNEQAAWYVWMMDWILNIAAMFPSHQESATFHR